MGVASERLPGRKVKQKGYQRNLGSIRSEFNNPEKRTAYWMILPTTLIVLLVAAWPILYAVWLSLQRILPNTTEWVWFSNYTRMFSDPVFYSALFNTLSFHDRQCVLRVHPRSGDRDGPQQDVQRTGSRPRHRNHPMGISDSGLGGNVASLLSRRSGNLRCSCRVDSVTTESSLPMMRAYSLEPSCRMSGRRLPSWRCLLLAGLQTIPGDVYEAARVDGATKWQQFTRITLPLLKPAILVALLFRTLDAWRVYDLFWSMSDRQLDSLSTYVFEFVQG